MLFEVINSQGKTIFYTNEKICVPPYKQIKTMLTTGYKFRLDGKIMTKKSLEEFTK